MIFAALLAALAITPADTTYAPGVGYRIEATLDEATDVLHGRARLRYTNRAPVAMDTLFFHQHLNAFRPNSAWARRELEFGERRFQDLTPEQHAFERLTSATVDGTAVRPVYPGAPDSTVVALPLPQPLQPGQTATVMMDWDARLATELRRQGRKGRHYDWAQWYPRIAVYESDGWAVQPLLPQGEFYGEFGSYDVTVDVAADQVIGSTGVPVEGDPGWQAAARNPQPVIAFRRDAYASSAPEALGLLDDAPAEGRKRVRWRAERVHHFAWTNSPDYIYEQGAVPAAGSRAAVPIHVLYQPGDTAWDDGVVVARTEKALAWLEGIFGPYPWPQLTNVHRLESGGTEFPMLIMDGSDNEGLIVHETAHQYVHGIFANNEWQEGWLDEGFASFLTNWYFEEQAGGDVWGRTLERQQAQERAGRTELVSTASADFSSPGIYSSMTYTKGSLFFWMLRGLVGEPTMRDILHQYYEQYALKHVDEAAFRSVAERVSGQDLGWFFEQWLHTTHTLDYGIGATSTTRLADGRWRTRLDVLRLGGAWMPVTLRVGDVERRLDSREMKQTVEVVTATRPAEAILDPESRLLDLDPSNNRKSLGVGG